MELFRSFLVMYLYNGGKTEWDSGLQLESVINKGKCINFVHYYYVFNTKYRPKVIVLSPPPLATSSRHVPKDKNPHPRSRTVPLSRMMVTHPSQNLPSPVNHCLMLSPPTPSHSPCAHRIVFYMIFCQNSLRRKILCRCP